MKLEGCLSIPRIWGPVKRANRVLLEYQDLSGEKKTEWFTGFRATIVLHEVDHLQGVLFTQRAIEQNSALYEERDGELERMKY
jgi:peptide deformylase